MAKSSFVRRVLRWGVTVFFVLLIADFLLLPLGLAAYAAWPAGAEVGALPNGFSTVELNAADGVRLVGWYAPSQNGAAIILVPGSGDSRASLRSHAEMLAENGFGVLALDPRGTGESEGQTNRLGWAGSRDVGGAVDFLAAQPEVEAIGGWGLSMGGEVLLGALGDYPQLAAVVADGATARCYAEKYDLESAGNIFAKANTRIMNLFVGLFTGDDAPTPIMESIGANETSRLLLIAAGDVQDEIDYNAMFAEAAEGRAAGWVVPDVGHTKGWDAHRAEYTQRVLEFFRAVLQCKFGVTGYHCN
jgi:pimeloyl-ACP methyl ester carboxylesterase